MNPERRVREIARGAGLDLSDDAVGAIVEQMRRVLAGNARLHLTSITDEHEFLERHVAESLAGAALLDPGISGTLLDLGSGNGYPGVPVAVARPALRAVLAEASARKAAFLRSLAELPGLADLKVIERQVQRAADLGSLESFDLLVTRATGSWERIVPRLVSRIAPSTFARVLVWCGKNGPQVAQREAWRKRLHLVRAHAIPRRDASWILELAPLGGARPN